MASAALISAINNAQKERLVIVLNELIHQCGAAIPIMEEQLLTDGFDSSGEANSFEDHENEEGDPCFPPDQSAKRKRALSQATTEPRKRRLFETCIQCNEEYNVLQNDKESCTWHPGTALLCFIITVLKLAGSREPDYESEVWDDWDEDCHGRILDQEDEFPEGFIWRCCEENGIHEGCELGRHRRQV